MNYILQPGYFIMYRKMLLGIKERAERTSPIEQAVEERAWRNEGRNRQLHLWLPGLPCPPLGSESSHSLRQCRPGLHFLVELGSQGYNLLLLGVGLLLPSQRHTLERLYIGGELFSCHLSLSKR